jgi:hypothetical protein
MATSKKLKLTRKPRKIKKRSVKRKTAKKHLKIGGKKERKYEKLRLILIAMLVPLLILCVGYVAIDLSGMLEGGNNIKVGGDDPCSATMNILSLIFEHLFGLANSIPEVPDISMDQKDVNAVSNFLDGLTNFFVDVTAPDGKIKKVLEKNTKEFLDNTGKFWQGLFDNNTISGGGLSFKVRGNDSIIDKCKDSEYKNKITKENGLWRRGVLYSQKQFIDCTEQDWWKEAYKNMTLGQGWGLDKYDKISTEEMQILNSIVLTGTYRYITKFSLFKSRQFSVLKQLKNLKDNKQKLEQQFNHIMNTELPNKPSGQNTIRKLSQKMGIDDLNFDKTWMVIRSFAHAIDYFCNKYEEDHSKIKDFKEGKVCSEDIQNTDEINPNTLKKVFTEYINPVLAENFALRTNLSMNK